MSDLLREQLSAFMDGELPREECSLLLKRVSSNTELGECWHNWHLIGDTLRGDLAGGKAHEMAARVARALDAQAQSGSSPGRSSRAHMKHRFRRRGAAIAAGVAVIGVAGLAGALVSRHVGGGQVLVPGAAQSAALDGTVHHVDWRQAPRPLRRELNRYLLMHQVYGTSPMPAGGADTRSSAVASSAGFTASTGGS